jgi:formylmethanofuran dehydrogenase subunit E
MLAWIFLFVVLGGVGKLIYDIQQQKTKGVIGIKSKTQTEYSQEFETQVREVIIKTLKTKPKKRKPKSVEEWEEEIDLGGYE